MRIIMKHEPSLAQRVTAALEVVALEVLRANEGVLSPVMPRADTELKEFGFVLENVFREHLDLPLIQVSGGWEMGEGWLTAQQIKLATLDLPGGCFRQAAMAVQKNRIPVAWYGFVFSNHIAAALTAASKNTKRPEAGLPAPFCVAFSIDEYTASQVFGAPRRVLQRPGKRFFGLGLVVFVLAAVWLGCASSSIAFAIQ